MTARTNNDAETATKEIVTAAPQNVLNEHAEAIRILGKRTVHDIIEIGRRLAEVKKQIGRVSFLPWIEREFGWSEDTAERFMALHALQRQLPQVAELSIPFSGLYLLAAPSTPPEAVEAVIARTEAGQRVSVGEIKATIEEARVGEDLERRSSRSAAAPRVASSRRAGPSQSPRPLWSKNAPAPTIKHVDLIAAWNDAPPEERTRAIDGIGLKPLLAALPEAWIPLIEEWLAARRKKETAR